MVRCGQVKWEELPQLSPQAALDFDLYFNCTGLIKTKLAAFEIYYLSWNEMVARF